MMFGIGEIIGGVVGIGRDWLKDRAKRKGLQLELDSKLAIAQAEAKIKYMQAQQSADISWENLSIQQNGWKDEFFTVLLSLPLILCFIPGMAPYVADGFSAVKDNVPDWYRWAFMVAVASAFGYRKLADVMSLRKGA